MEEKKSEREKYALSSFFSALFRIIVIIKDSKEISANIHD